MKNTVRISFGIRQRIKQFSAVLLVFCLLLGMIPESLQEILKIQLVQNTKATTTLSNPRIVADTSMQAGQKVTWDCIYFGSYPQREVVAEASQSGVYGRVWSTADDYIVDSSLYNELKSATGWNSNGDLSYGNEKYRRIKKDIIFGTNNKNPYYNWWSDSTTYHYFKYEPIKWRVLRVNESSALLLADKVLDDQMYNQNEVSVTWENSSIRSWLNGYGTSVNQPQIDYTTDNFLKCAFSIAEETVIETTNVINNNSILYSTNGGNDTSDKIFLLSEEEVYTDTAKAYGFASSFYNQDEARRSKSSTYAKAMWIETDSYDCWCGNCWWWLRSPGERSEHHNSGTFVDTSGYVQGQNGFCLSSLDYGVRPALNLDLSSSNLWSYAGTVCSDGTVDENAAPGSGAGDNKPSSGNITGNITGDKNIANSTVTRKVSSVTINGISNQIAIGKKLQLKVAVSPANATNKKVIWKSNNTGYATVTSTGLVTMTKKSAGKTVIITATVADGSGKKAIYKITGMKGAVKSLKLSGKKTMKVKASQKLKCSVKVTKGKANKKLKWTSSNPKIATVSSAGKVKAISKGKVKITAMSTDGTNKKKSITITIK